MIKDVACRTSMEVLSYIAGTGWDSEIPKHLDSVGTLVLAFGHPRYASESSPLDELRRSFPSATILGCSTAGEILGSEVRDDSISVGVYRFSRSRLRFASSTIINSAGSFDAGRQLGESLCGPELAAVFVISTGLDVNGSDLVRGLNCALPANVVVTGGLAGDGPNFKRTWVLENGKPVDQRVTAVGLYGDALRIGHGSQGGFDPFGPKRIVTRAEGNVLFELDGRPALSLYREYLGDRAKSLPSSALLFPLSVQSQSEPDKFLVRTVLAIDEEAQSVTFAGDLPEGSASQLMRSNFDRLITAAGTSSHDARVIHGDDSSGPVLSIAISCVGRRLILGQRTEDELEATTEALGPVDRQIGFYSYGELSPFATGRCELHNQTMTITTICELALGT